MNTKVLLGFLGGLLMATGVFYVQSNRTPKTEAQAPVPVAAAPSVATPVAPAPPPPVETPAQFRKAVTKPVKKPALPATALVPVEQARVERPPAAPEPPPAPIAAPEPTPPAQATPPPPPPAETKPEPPQPRSVTIASGTLVTVRLGETISSERSRQGDSFMATLDGPLVVDGLVIAETNISLNQLVPRPFASGVMPFSFSALDTVMNSSQVVGGVRPAFWKTSLLMNRPRV